MTMLAFVNLFALAFLFKIAMRILKDYDDQRAAGIKTPVFDSSQFPDLDLDRKAWPANPVKSEPAAQASAELNAQTQR
jgi:alanine or glycine:cation symporter, AGCS family